MAPTLSFPDKTKSVLLLPLLLPKPGAEEGVGGDGLVLLSMPQPPSHTEQPPPPPTLSNSPPHPRQVPAWSGFPSWLGKQNHTKVFLSRISRLWGKEVGGGAGILIPKSTLGSFLSPLPHHHQNSLNPKSELLSGPLS